MAERLTVTDIGCWVIKSRTPAAQLGDGWGVGATRELTRCLRRSYRVALMEPGQPCLLWVSGREQPGVQALGRLASGAELPYEPDSGRREVQVRVLLRRLADPVPRSALLADHVLADAEVLRMPAGSNPSYLSPLLWGALRELLGHDQLG